MQLLPSPPATTVDDDASRLADWFSQHRRVFVLTGAGCSTASGIPGYRGDDGRWTRPPPVTWQGFTGDPAIYRRYWARSHVGWPRFDRARPNEAHRALAALDDGGLLAMLVTQNVDGLHQRAGSRRVIDLHGRIDAVVCLGCGDRLSRASLQARLLSLNPCWSPGPATSAPDGDADIDEKAEQDFVPPQCMRCGGLLKPDVVFFGENVPRERYGATLDAFERADAMLVAGSSLMVYSGFRFARMAHERGLPLAILNRGNTRADGLAGLRLDGDLGGTLATAVRRLHLHDRLEVTAPDDQRGAR
ncbi:NAD-dependent protein deacetylase [Luteimonas yindakuii]|uniref:NAD-dependent protein deacetylase n=1 Tax=Luteimonas yindakuii TaxID=2565782 RepID=UPI0010A41B98|nr:NAD-dependent protein deacetylase [Luteimonas yindakuii]QCO67514.1 NAD-dependent protein deacetylase [Luteimonas yindakuii]